MTCVSFFFFQIGKTPRLSKARLLNLPGPFCRLLLVSVAIVFLGVIKILWGWFC